MDIFTVQTAICCCFFLLTNVLIVGQMPKALNVNVNAFRDVSEGVACVTHGVGALVLQGGPGVRPAFTANVCADP